jgi:hypothetical protein
MSNFAGLYDIRLGTQADTNLILATFLRGLYYSNEYFNKIPKDIFMDNYKLNAYKIVLGPTNKIKVACLKEDPDVILGYALLNSDETVLHWVFVKAAWRHKGIAKSLVPDTITSVSHINEVGSTLLTISEKQIVFNPFKLK